MFVMPAMGASTTGTSRSRSPIVSGAAGSVVEADITVDSPRDSGRPRPPRGRAPRIPRRTRLWRTRWPRRAHGRRTGASGCRGARPRGRDHRRARAARSLEEAAELLGITPGDIVKSLVVKRSDDTYVFALVPGGRKISWPKLRGAARREQAAAAGCLARPRRDGLRARHHHAARLDDRVARRRGRDASPGAGCRWAPASTAAASSSTPTRSSRAFDATVADISDPE